MEYKHYDVEVKVVVANVVEVSPERAEQKAKNLIIKCAPGVPQLCVAVVGATAHEQKE